MQELKHQLLLIQQAVAQDPDQFVTRAKQELERLAHARARLERTCMDLRIYRDTLSDQIQQR